MVIIILTIAALLQQVLFIHTQFTNMFTMHGSAGRYILNLLKSGQLSLAPLYYFIAAQLILYMAFITIIYILTINIGILLKLNLGKQYILAVILWFLGAIFILIFNSYYFPHSRFAPPLNPLLLKTTLIILTIIVITALITALIGLVKNRKYFTVFIVILISLFLFYNKTPQPVTFVPQKNKPNIIILGLDSIRPDHIQYAPHVLHFLNSNTKFTNAFSPMARTYVAWNSILTGKYPKTDKVRDNLIDPDTLNLSNTLVTTLKKAGYETIFATDSREFSLINKRFAFDHIISPKMGIYDFIFSMLNDTPLSNLIINTRLGQWLFPYNYANRMSYVTYEPKTFDRLLKNKLAERKNKPLFLGIHLVLSHWPFYWAHDHLLEYLDLPEKYNDSVQAIDKQFVQVINILQKNNLLKHAILFVVSDHGLSLGLPGDRIISNKKYIGNKEAIKILSRYPYSKSARKKNMPYTALNTSSGEGVDILSFNSSNRIIFGIKSDLFSAKIINKPVSLIDIAPTIIDLLHLAPLEITDGISIKKLFYPRPLFFETGIWIPLFTIKDIEEGHTDKYLATKLRTLFAYKSKGNLLVIRKSAMKDLLASKQRGILYGNWFLAHYPAASMIHSLVVSKKAAQKLKCDFKQDYDPQGDTLTCYTFTVAPHSFYVLVNTRTGSWTLDLKSKLAQKAPLAIMMQKFRDFYGNELA